TYSTWNITDPTLVVGSTFSVQVNVTNAPPFNGYEFALFFDPAFIQVKNYDLSSGIFPSPYPAIEFNGNGSLRLSVVNTGQLITAGFGPLLSITFIVIKAGGVSPLAFAAPAMTPSNFAQPPDVVCRNCPAGTPNWTRLVAGSTPIDVQTSDGYFDNVLGSSNPYGPTADFKFTPSNPFQGETVKFNATASFDPDNRAAQNNGISEYIWDFGDKSSQPYVTSISPIVSHAFAPGGSDSLNSTFFLGNFSVRLTVLDRDSNFLGMKTMLLTMSPVANHCVAVTGIFLTKNQVDLGQKVTFQVDVKDSGTFPEKYNLTVSYGPPNATLPRVSGQNITVSKSVSWPFSFSTANFNYGIYNLVAKVTLFGGQDNCKDGTNLSQFGINQPILPGQVLLLVGGVIGIPVSLGIAAYLIGFFRKKKRLASEAL